MPSRSTYINHHARTSRLRLVAVKTIFFHILIPLPGLKCLTHPSPIQKLIITKQTAQHAGKSESKKTWDIGFTALKHVARLLRPALFAGVPRLLGNGSPFALGRDTSPAFTFAMYVCGDAGTGGLASIGDQFPGATVGLCMPHKHFDLNTKGPLAGSVFHSKDKKQIKAAKSQNKQWLKTQLARFFACSSRGMYKQRQGLLQQSVLTSAGAFGKNVNAGVMAILQHLSSWHKHPDYFHNASGIPTVNANNMPLENWRHWHHKIKYSTILLHTAARLVSDKCTSPVHYSPPPNCH